VFRAVEGVETLDTIAAVLPIERSNNLAELLSDQDVDTVKYLVNEGMGENTLRADLRPRHLEAWSLAASVSPLPWPAPEALLLKFVAHYLWEPARRESEPDHGMPVDVDQVLRNGGLLKASEHMRQRPSDDGSPIGQH
jgi:hypothetical protein